MGGSCSVKRPPADGQTLGASPPDAYPNRGKRGSVQTSSDSSASMAAFVAEHGNKTASPPGGRRQSAVKGDAPIGVLSLSKTLEDSEAKGAFMSFARADMSEENLEFFYVVSDFHAAWDACEPDGRGTLVSEIVDRYLKAGAEKQVCIGDSKVRRVVELAAEGTISRDMFDSAQQIAKKTLLEDIFPRFEDSEAGKSLARRPDLCEP